jgi:hypothetical protein
MGKEIYLTAFRSLDESNSNVQYAVLVKQKVYWE